MMLTQPRGGIPIGKVTINGRAFDVETNGEYLRFFTDLVQRSGGVSGTTVTDVSALSLLTVDKSNNLPSAPDDQSVMSMRMAMRKQETPPSMFDSQFASFVRSIAPKQPIPEADFVAQRVFARR